MFLQDSRYENAASFAVTESSPGLRASVRPRRIGAATGMLEYVLKPGDRLDLLARHFYGDDRLWWRILDANPQLGYGLELLLEARLGDVILIPGAEE